MKVRDAMGRRLTSVLLAGTCLAIGSLDPAWASGTGGDGGATGVPSTSGNGGTGFGAYIDNLHVHPERRSAGLGRRLLGDTMRRVAGRGETGAYLWVFDGNIRAIDFYRRLGGEIVEGGFDEIDGVEVAQSRNVWRDIARLAAACEATSQRDR